MTTTAKRPPNKAASKKITKHTTAKGQPRPALNSDVLISAINRYGRAEFAKAISVSRATVNLVCINYRSLGVENAWLAARVLDLPLSACVSQKRN